MAHWRVLVADGRHAWRSLRRAPGFTLPALFTVSLAVGLLVSLQGVVAVESVRSFSISTVLRPFAVPDPGWGTTWSVALVPSSVQQVGALDAIMVALSLTVAVAVLIAALTLTNLLLSRVDRKAHELATQSALGATAGRLLTRLAAEAACVAGIGVGLGALLGFVGGAVLRITWPHALGAGGETQTLWTMGLGVALPIAALIVVPILSGYAAGDRGRAGLLSGGLLSGERVVKSGSGLLRDALVVAQLAASLALLVGAGLLLREPLGPGGRGQAALAVRDTLALRLELDAERLADAEARARYLESLLAGVRGLPTVQDTAIASVGTLIGVGPRGLVMAACGACYRGGVYVPLLPGAVRYHAVSPGFFAALGIDVRTGREFDAGDCLGSEPVAIVSDSFAADHFEDGRAVGRDVRLGGATGPSYRVVGVVPDLAGSGLGAGAVPALYLPLLQEPPRAVELAVRTGGDATGRLEAVRERVRVLGAGVRVGAGSSLAAELRSARAPVRWLGFVLAVAGAAALLMAVQGLTSVMRHNVERRRRELAVRMSVGASPLAVVRLVMKRTLVVAAAGVVVGVWAALPLVGWAGGLLPGGGSLHLGLAMLVATVLAVATLLGGALPAWSASRRDPGSILRE